MVLGVSRLSLCVCVCERERERAGDWGGACVVVRGHVVGARAGAEQAQAPDLS